MDSEVKESCIEFEDGILVCADNLEWLKKQPSDSIDLIIGSPPYEDRRTYDIGFDLKGQDWVDWMKERWIEYDRVCTGCVAMVVDSPTIDFQWTATSFLLGADLHRAGIRLRKPPLYIRDGICGSGGPDWFANKYEFIICSSKGKLPWSDNTALGHPCIYESGGAMSNRHRDGQRANREGKRAERLQELGRGSRGYSKPDKANPGNLIDCGAVGGGNMGSDFAHEGEAPFPEQVPEFFILSCCPKGGVVCDPFVGTGTTVSVARQNRRRFIGIDIRQSQIDISKKRLEQATLRQGFDIEV